MCFCKRVGVSCVFLRTPDYMETCSYTKKGGSDIPIVRLLVSLVGRMCKWFSLQFTVPKPFVDLEVLHGVQRHPSLTVPFHREVHTEFWQSKNGQRCNHDLILFPLKICPLFIYLFLRQKAGIQANVKFTLSREEISQPGIEPPTSSLRFGYLSTIIQQFKVITDQYAPCLDNMVSTIHLRFLDEDFL